MDFPTNIRRGERIPAQMLNGMISYLLKAIVPGPGIFFRRVGNQLVISAENRGGRGGGGSMEIATVVSGQNDYLTCTLASGSTVSVAKQYLLQVTPFDGNSVTFPDSATAVSYSYSNAYTRTATKGSFSETQQVEPLWFVGEKITISSVSTGLTDGSGNAINWVESGPTRLWTRIVS